MVDFTKINPDIRHANFLNILRVLSFVIVITAIISFVYYAYVTYFELNYYITIGCFAIFFAGIFLWLTQELIISEKAFELTPENVKSKVKKLGWLSLAIFDISFIIFFIGLIMLKSYSDQYTIVFLSSSIILFILAIFLLIQRLIIQHHYELKQQQQTIIELLQNLTKKE